MKSTKEIYQCSVLNREIYINLSLEYVMSAIEAAAAAGCFEIKIAESEINRSNNAQGFMQRIITTLEDNGYTCQLGKDYTSGNAMLYISWYEYGNQNEI